MLTAVEKILLDVQEALEGYYAGRSAQQVLQRSAMLPAQYSVLHDRFESVVKANYPTDDTYALLDEIEHALHELQLAKKEEKKHKAQTDASHQNHPAAWQNKPTKAYFDTPQKNKPVHRSQLAQKPSTLRLSDVPRKNAPAFQQKFVVSPVKLSEAPPVRQEIRSPFGTRHSRELQQQAQQERQQTRQSAEKEQEARLAYIARQESRVAFFREAITKQSSVIKKTKEGEQTVTLKPELDLDCWLRREYLVDAPFQNDAEWENLCQTTGYLFDGQHGVEETFWDIEIGTYPDKDPAFNKLQINGLIYPYFAKNWYGIMKLKRLFFFCGEAIADVRRLFLASESEEAAKEEKRLKRLEQKVLDEQERQKLALMHTEDKKKQKRIEAFLAHESSRDLSRDRLLGLVFGEKKTKTPRKFQALPEQVLSAKAWSQPIAPN